MPTITLYRFKYRRTPGAAWSQTKHRMTIEEAATRYGEGNYEVMEYTKEEREVQPEGNSAAHVQSSPGMPKG